LLHKFAVLIWIFSVMGNFEMYFNEGWKHIADWKGNDHILFVMALCLRYVWQDWKKLLVLVTAFTIGHTITLALSVFDIVSVSTKWIEFLIPVTILITAISNLFVKKFVFKSKFSFIYFFALFFGLIHGLGFSNYLKSILGKDQNILVQLLAFNIGLEVGQLLIVAAILLLGAIVVGLFKASRREYIVFISGAVFGLALQMLLDRWPL
jgi:HupE / UreJ protein